MYMLSMYSCSTELCSTVAFMKFPVVNSHLYHLAITLSLLSLVYCTHNIYSEGLLFSTLDLLLLFLLVVKCIPLLLLNYAHLSYPIIPKWLFETLK